MRATAGFVPQLQSTQDGSTAAGYQHRIPPIQTSPCRAPPQSIRPEDNEQSCMLPTYSAYDLRGSNAERSRWYSSRHRQRITMQQLLLKTSVTTAETVPNRLDGSTESTSKDVRANCLPAHTVLLRRPTGLLDTLV